MPTVAHTSTPNVVLYNLRDAAGLTQRELADALNELAAEFKEAPTVDANQISRWERGIIERPRATHQRLLARVLGVSIEELGFTRPRYDASGIASTSTLLDLAMVDGRPMLDDPAVDRSQQEWRTIRRLLNSSRQALADVARRLYPTDVQVGTTGLIAGPGWLLDRPVDADDVRLTAAFETAGPPISGTEPESAAFRPLATVLSRYSRYSHAIRQVERPALFENRLSYRLTELSHNETPAMSYGLTTYFDMVDVCEVAAHELAATHLVPGREVPTEPSWRRLKFRRLIDDPFDLTRRTVLPSTDTLTIRDSPDGASFVLHQRDPSKVALAAGQLHLMPAGVFQPSSIYPAAQVADLNLWRNIAREFSEEFLGNPEHNGDGLPADYDAEPLAAFQTARDSGALRLHYFGLALDALTLAGEILTVAVIEASTFDHLFADMVLDNAEGQVITSGHTRATPLIPFAEPVVRQLLDDRRLAPAAAGCLDLAWKHRRQLLGRKETR